MAERYEVMEPALDAADLRWRRSFQRGLEALPVRLSTAGLSGGHGPTG